MLRGRGKLSNKRLLMDFPGCQWLRLHASNVKAMGSIPGWGSSVLHVMAQKKKKKGESLWGNPSTLLLGI